MTKRMTADLSPGEAAARQRRSRLSVILACLMLLGGVIGFLSAHFEVENGGFMEGIPPFWAVTASVLTLIGIGYGSWRYNQATDELDRRDSQWASAVALNVYIVGYFTWYLWWRGGLVREPAHLTIFFVTLIVMMAAYAFKKFKP